MHEVLVALLLCPVCYRKFEVPERVISQGSLCRCSRCGKVLEIISTHPVGLKEKAFPPSSGYWNEAKANPVGDQGGYEC